MKLPKNKNMRRILAAQLPADFADWLDYIAIISLFTFVLKVETVYFAWFIVALTLPYVFIGPFAGALVDRMDIRSVMVLSNFGRALLTFALALVGQPELMLALVAARGAVDSFFSPAKQVAIQALSAREELMSTNSASHLINQISKVAGPAVGGGLLLLLSPQMVFVVNGAVSLCAALILMTLPSNIRDVKKPETAGEKTSLLAEAGEGFMVVLSKPPLWITIGLGAMGFFAIFLHDTLIGPMTRELGFGEHILGLSITCVGLGGVLGAFAVSNLNKQIHPYLIIGPSMMIVSSLTITLGFIVLYGVSIPDFVFVAMFFIIGFIGVGTFVPLRTVLQIETPPDKMGRVTAVSEMTTIVAMLGAPFIGAALAQIYQLGVPFIAGGTLSFVIGIVALILVRFVHINLSTDEDGTAADLPKERESV